MTVDPSKDPLLQPFQLKHLTLRNWLMSTAHEPSYSEDDVPKDRYRLYSSYQTRHNYAAAFCDFANQSWRIEWPQTGTS
jgi:hypothetical protein